MYGLSGTYRRDSEVVLIAWVKTKDIKLWWLLVAWALSDAHPFACGSVHLFDFVLLNWKSTVILKQPVKHKKRSQLFIHVEYRAFFLTSGFFQPSLALFAVTLLTSNGPCGLEGAPRTTNSTVSWSLPLTLTAFNVYFPVSRLQACTNVKSVWYGLISILSFSVLVSGISSLQLHDNSGSGSPETSTDHLCDLPALIVMLLNVERSMRGFTKNNASN
jgi:hypothetical protein